MNNLNKISPFENIDIYNEDCRDTMRRMIKEDIKVDLTVTSCPYDDLRKYNNSSTWNFEIFKEIGIITLFVFVFGVVFSCIKWIADKEKYYIEDEETNGNE